MPVAQVKDALTYRIPAALDDAVAVGTLVRVSVGRQRLVGVVTRRLAEGAPLSSSVDSKRLKFIDSVVPSVALTPRQVELCSFVARYYHASIGESVRLALPPDVSKDASPPLRVTDKGAAARVFGKAHGLGAAEERALALFEEGERKTWPSLKRKGATRSAVNKLLHLGLLEEVVAKEESTKGLERALVPLDDGEDIPTRATALRALDVWIRARLKADGQPPLWAEARVAHSGATGKIKRLLAMGRIEVRTTPRRPKLTAALEGDREVQLTEAQRECVESLCAALEREDDAAAFLLEGVTGSGKTEVYLRAARAALDMGRGVLFAVPEIALTPQLFARVAARFDDEEVCVLHSGLTVRDRRDALARLREGHARVALGARSALFAPVENLGLIIVDEEHDGSLKNAGSAPRYHGRDVALWRGQNEDAVVVLGSATPSLESRLNVLRDKLVGLSLPTRVGSDGQLPQVHVVDLRERSQFREMKKRDRSVSDGTPGPILTGPLVDAVDAALHRGEQALLFLNRRGYAAFLLCEACGEIAQCPSCAVSLTFHKGKNLAVCHHCDFAGPLPTACEQCGGAILTLGLGTERVEAEVAAQFPNARVGRLDRDTASKPGAVSALLAQMQRGDLDILIGTQMVAKGHDFPRLTVVGVILADVALAVPDFRASERAFSLLTQVAGRAGRAEREGHVYFQTYNPTHPAIAFAARHDVKGFAAQELLRRDEARYPPFSRAALFRVENEDESAALAIGRRVGERLRAVGREHLARGQWDVLGPALAPLSRLQGKSRVHVFLWCIHAQDRARLCAAVTHDADLDRAIRQSQSRLILDVDPAHVL